MRRYALRDDQWDRIKDFLPGREGHVGGTAADNRVFVEAVLYRYRAGIPWRDLPERFGDWKIVHQRFSRWAKSGVFERIFKQLASDHDNEYMMIDATIVRAHQHSAGAKAEQHEARAGKSRDQKSREWHATLARTYKVLAEAERDRSSYSLPSAIERARFLSPINGMAGGAPWIVGNENLRNALNACADRKNLAQCLATRRCDACRFAAVLPPNAAQAAFG